MPGFKGAFILLIGLAVAKAQSSTGNCGSILQGTIIADQTNCNSYFVCNNGLLLSYTCPNNQAYDSNSQTCVQDYSCVNQVSIDTNNGYNPYYPYYPNNQYNPYNPYYPNNQYNPYYPSPIYNQPSVISNSNPCYGMASGSYVASSSCNQFYYCNNGQAYLTNCPNGYSFNQAQNVCSNTPCYTY
ncbi:unnamed protein product [Hermetia illucens]|uniref:Chitin-binding type-2 domain-containing protein n=1 Tax=Hermetia illucens TaxID=343691 RepID=A0A7R8YSK1_HERIL|nr:uncharacterized protein C35A5.10-like [Hermetia illucens]CAD7080684.1 unnamed protein product [Hermetia illucens]